MAFDSDCREGTCSSCGCVVNGVPHGPGTGETARQLFMRAFTDGDTLVVEPLRAKAFPVLKDLCVDRGAFDRIIASGGYLSANTGAAPDGNAMLIGRDIAEQAFDAAGVAGQYYGERLLCIELGADQEPPGDSSGLDGPARGLAPRAGLWSTRSITLTRRKHVNGRGDPSDTPLVFPIGSRQWWRAASSPGSRRGGRRWCDGSSCRFSIRTARATHPR